MKKKQALSDMGVLAVVVILGVVLFFLAPHFLPKKSAATGTSATGTSATGTSPSEVSKSSVSAPAPVPGAGMGAYGKAYQIGTSKAKAAQGAAEDRNTSL